jgi:riboflavin biosynthesis pyrimidine reductase
MPDLAPTLEQWRASMGLARQPTTIVVSASGDLDFRHRGLSAPDVPVIIATTAAGARRLRDVPGNVAVSIAVSSAGDGGGERIAPAAIGELLAANDLRLALCEGGPHLLTDLIAARLVDELFLTIAPQLIGRPSATGRLGLLEGLSLLGSGAGWAGLVGIHRAGDDLFLRYSFERPESAS